MESVIKKELKEFEEEYNIEIISARDTGSRAWNLQSPDSDYDVSFIYIQKPADYITTSGYKQNINRETSTEHDIEYNSWNLDRFLALLKGSNPAAIEYLQSDTTYYGKYSDYMSNLETHTEENFKPLALMMHHHNLAKSQYERYLSQKKKFTVKRHLYALRSLYYREYVKKNRELPSLDFPKFFKENKNIASGFAPHTSHIKRMIKHKQNGNSTKKVNTNKIAHQIGKQLQNTIPDEEKPDYTQQNISTDYINQETTKLIKEINQEPCTWKTILSTWKAHITS